jgi:N-methylhydantoinase A/oxoprolinase/acetone carboxylase beta subunit
VEELRKIRMGIDVGGTHTKAVAIDNTTHKIIGKSSVKTTHDHEQGVAAGVVESFQNCLKENGIDPKRIVFVAHSTTQATNALIEGDVADIGIFGIARGGIEGFLAKRQLKMGDIVLGSGRSIKVINSFSKLKELDKMSVERLVDDLVKQGAQVIVASMAFGVDHNGAERLVQAVCVEKGIPCTVASDITKLYGLTRRTRTATINASILPKMLLVANSTETTVKESGVDVPLMIMRGDGGVMEIAEMKRRPILSMLSGPAASVMGSLMYLRASNGIYFEVGGTTTNIGVIKNGRPTIDYSFVGGHETYISSLDVRITGCAGGSMIRANAKGVVDVGPRSAHIAGLDYATYADPTYWTGGTVEFFSPKKGDPADYVAIRFDNGERVTITNSCAANVLGLVEPEHFAYGNKEAAKQAIAVLAQHCGTTTQDIAIQIMECAYTKLEPVILELAEKYKLEKDQISLVGVGGGAASIIIYLSEKMGLKYAIPENAEVISSIGVALALVRDVVERMIPSPSKEALRAIKTEAMNKAIESGATPESVEVFVEIDPQTSKVTAIATGSTEVKTTDLLAEVTVDEACTLAATDLNLQSEDIDLLERSPYFYIFGSSIVNVQAHPAIRILDQKGFIKVQRAAGEVIKTTAGNYAFAVKKLWEEMAIYQTEVILRPDFYICAGPRVMDFSVNDFETLMLLIDIEMSILNPNEEIIIVAANSQ